MEKTEKKQIFETSASAWKFMRLLDDQKIDAGYPGWDDESNKFSVRYLACPLDDLVVTMVLKEFDKL